MRRKYYFCIMLCCFWVSACQLFSIIPIADSAGVETSTNPTESIAEIIPTENLLLDPSPTTLSGEKVGQVARQHLQAIADEIGSRIPGSPQEAQTAAYIFNAFSDMGYQPEVQEFSAYDEEERETIRSSNIIAIHEGLSEQIIVVGAHYDSTYEEDSMGADDNASGVAVMLETAQTLANMELPYTIYFIAFGSEELALNGSTYFVERLEADELQKIIGMVNLDSLIAGDKMYVYGNEGPGSMRDWVLTAAHRFGFNVEGKTDEEMLYPDGSLCECSDNDAFEKEGIPYVYFEATNWDLSPDAMIQVDPEFGDDGEIRHTEFDSIDYIDQNFPNRIENHFFVYTTLLLDLLAQYP